MKKCDDVTTGSVALGFLFVFFHVMCAVNFLSVADPLLDSVGMHLLSLSSVFLVL